jgi:hypothetical protein
MVNELLRFNQRVSPYLTEKKKERKCLKSFVLVWDQSFFRLLTNRNIFTALDTDLCIVPPIRGMQNHPASIAIIDLFSSHWSILISGEPLPQCSDPKQ